LLGHLRSLGPHERGAGRWIWCWGRVEADDGDSPFLRAVVPIHFFSPFPANG
jgi:hypothetical protein